MPSTEENSHPPEQPRADPGETPRRVSAVTTGVIAVNTMTPPRIISHHRPPPAASTQSLILAAPTHLHKGLDTPTDTSNLRLKPPTANEHYLRLRRHRLHPAQHRRTRHQQTQTIPRRGHPLRQTRLHLRRHGRCRLDPHLAPRPCSVIHGTRPSSPVPPDVHDLVATSRDAVTQIEGSPVS